MLWLPPCACQRCTLNIDGCYNLSNALLIKLLSHKAAVAQDAASKALATRAAENKRECAGMVEAEVLGSSLKALLAGRGTGKRTRAGGLHHGTRLVSARRGSRLPAAAGRPTAACIP